MPRVGGLLTTLVSMILVATLPHPVGAQAPPGDSLRLKVDGMVCSLCAYGVERRLKSLHAVDQVRVELDSALVVLLLQPGGAVSDSVLQREVRRAGFSLRGVSRYARSPGMAKPRGQR